MNGAVMNNMADISALGNLNPVEALDLDTYADTTAFRLPKAGEYILRAPDGFPAEAFSASKAGYLTARIDPTIMGPSNEGFQIRYVRVSTKPYESKGTQVSQAGLYLRACGVSRTPGTPQEIANAIAGTAGLTYRAYIDWEARHFATGFSLKGMNRFPSDGNGGFQSWIEHPSEKADDGSPLRLRANLVVSRFLNAA